MIILILLPGGCGWEGLKKCRDQLYSRISRARGSSDHATIQIPRHFDIIDGSISVKLEAIDWITMYCRVKSLNRGSYSGSIALNEVSRAGLRSRPYFVAPPSDCIRS